MNPVKYSPGSTAESRCLLQPLVKNKTTEWSLTA